MTLCFDTGSRFWSVDSNYLVRLFGGKHQTLWRWYTDYTLNEAGFQVCRCVLEQFLGNGHTSIQVAVPEWQGQCTIQTSRLTPQVALELGCFVVRTLMVYRTIYKTTCITLLSCYTSQ